jgi:hypothetical protein
MEVLLSYRGKKITKEDVLFIRDLIAKTLGNLAGSYPRNFARLGVGDSQTGYFGVWSAGG